MKVLITLFLFGAIFLNSTQYNFFPSTCCQFFKEDDAVALDWMNRNIPPDANILISASEAFVFESLAPGYTGSDGGVWITPLIQRRSESLPNQTDFGTQSILDNLCKSRITHIYVGGNDESFDSTQLQNRPDRYEMLLLLPNAKVYKMVGCRSNP